MNNSLDPSIDNDLYSAYEEHLEWFNDEKFKLESTRREARIEGRNEGINAQNQLFFKIIQLKTSGKTKEQVLDLFNNNPDSLKAIDIVFSNFTNESSKIR